MTEWLTHPASITIIVIAILTAIGRLIYWIGGMNDFRGAVETALNEIKESVSTIQGDIKSILRSLPANTVETDSPIRLNDLGRQVSLELQAVEWSESKANDLLGEVQGLTAYAIQEHCFKYAHEKYGDTEDRKRRAENSAYKHGLNIDQVLRVVGVELRDILLGRLNLEPPD